MLDLLRGSSVVLFSWQRGHCFENTTSRNDGNFPMAGAASENVEKVQLQLSAPPNDTTPSNTTRSEAALKRRLKKQTISS